MLTLIQQYEKLLTAKLEITKHTEDRMGGIFDHKEELSFSKFLLELVRFASPALFHIFILLLQDGVTPKALHKAYRKDAKVFLQILYNLVDAAMKKDIHLPKADAEMYYFCSRRGTHDWLLKLHLYESFLLKRPALKQVDGQVNQLLYRYAFMDDVPNQAALLKLLRSGGVLEAQLLQYDFWTQDKGGFFITETVGVRLERVQVGNHKALPTAKAKTSSNLPNFFYFRDQSPDTSPLLEAAHARTTAWDLLLTTLKQGSNNTESFILYLAHCGIPIEQIPTIMMKDVEVFLAQRENFLSMGYDVAKLKKFEVKNSHLVTGSLLNPKEKALFQEYLKGNQGSLGQSRLSKKTFWNYYFLESIMVEDGKGGWKFWDYSTPEIRQKKYDFLQKEYLRGCKCYVYSVCNNYNMFQFLTSTQIAEFVAGRSSSNGETRDRVRKLIAELAVSSFDSVKSTTESPFLHRKLLSVPKNLISEERNTQYEKAKDKLQRLVFRPAYGQVGWFDPTSRILEVSGGLTEACGIYASSRRSILVLGASVLGLDNTKFTGWLHLQHDSSTGVFILPDQDWDRLSPLFHLGWFLYPQFQRHTNIDWKMLPSKNGGTWDACYGYLGHESRFNDKGNAGVTALLSATTPNLDRDNYGLVGLHIPKDFFPSDLKPLAEKLAKNPAPMQTNLIAKFLTFELGCIEYGAKKVMRQVPTFDPKGSRWEWDKKKAETLQPLDVHSLFGCQVAQAVKNLKNLHYISGGVGDNASKIQGGRAKIVKGVLVPRKTPPSLSNYELWYNICRPHKQGIYINEDNSAGNIKDQRNCSVKELKGLNLSNKNRKSICSWEALLVK